MKIKSIQSTIDYYPELTPFERLIEFLRSRNLLTQQIYFETLKREFNYKPKN